MALRGQLTPTVQAAALRLLGREISRTELRLIPYVQYTIINGETLDGRKVNDEERHVLQDWVSRGYLPGPLVATLRCERYFWDVMSELLWLAYADHENQPE